MEGILDRQAVARYQEDLKKIVAAAIEADSPQLNIFLLEKRYEMLKAQEEDLELKIKNKQEEIEKILAELGGELLTLKQFLVYVCKEEGVCEVKLQELKEVLE